MKKLFCLILTALLSFTSKAKGAGGNKRPPHNSWAYPPLTNLSLNSQDWKIRYSIGMPLHPTTNPSGPGWFFDFPVHASGTFDDCNQSVCVTPDPDAVTTSCCESIHYLTQPYVGPLPIGQSLKAIIDISTTGNAVFLSQTQPGSCGVPAQVRFMVQVWEGPGIMLDSNARWWSNPVSLVLQDTGGPVLVSAPIDPSQWSNVVGQMGDTDADTLAAFQAAMQNHNAVGFTFGACFFGHGVGLAAGGTARFTLTDLRVD